MLNPSATTPIFSWLNLHVDVIVKWWCHVHVYHKVCATTSVYQYVHGRPVDIFTEGAIHLHIKG